MKDYRLEEETQEVWFHIEFLKLYYQELFYTVYIWLKRIFTEWIMKRC